VLRQKVTCQVVTFSQDQPLSIVQKSEKLGPYSGPGFGRINKSRTVLKAKREELNPQLSTINNQKEQLSQYQN
jgi:hypothetical protein